jgi:hypothetical protein
MAIAGVAPLLPGIAVAAPKQDGVTLVHDGAAVDLFVDQADDPAVARAAGDLAADLERVSGVRPRLRRTPSGMSATAVLIGTIGASPVIDRLIAEGRLDTSEVVGRWEASVTQVVERPLPGVARALPPRRRPVTRPKRHRPHAAVASRPTTETNHGDRCGAGFCNANTVVGAAARSGGAVRGRTAFPRPGRRITRGPSSTRVAPIQRR